MKHLVYALVASSLSLVFANGETVFREDFESGGDSWKPTEASAWKISNDGSNQAFELTKKRSDYKPPHRSPLNIALVKDVVVSDFELNLRMKTTEPSYGHRSLCLFFGYQDPTNFYYVHFGQETDDHANQIFIVNDAPRVKISSKTTEGTPWKEDHWHQVKIARDVQSGSIKVYFDNMEKPVMEANNKEFSWGQVGIGSFDDRGMFDDVELLGTRAPLRSKRMHAAVEGHQLDYWLHLPSESDAPVEGHPLILFLHGAGERGSDLGKVKVHGPTKLLVADKSPELKQFVVVAPQCPDKGMWKPETLKALVDEVVQSGANIDLSRLYITGLSMGGYGTWGFVSKYPNYFAAAAPICGGGQLNRLKISKGMSLENEFDINDLKVAKDLPIWAFHGEVDGVVPLKESEILVDALKSAGSERVKLTTYPGVNHDSWTQTYANPELYQWFLSHQKD